MDGGGDQRKAMTVDDIYRDFKGRRKGLIKALTTELDEFQRRCAPVCAEILKGCGVDVVLDYRAMVVSEKALLF